MQNTKSNEVYGLAETIWNYHQLNHKLEKADCILVLGSHDTRVAQYASQLFLDGYAPLLIFSGGLGNLTLGVWSEPEANIFAKIAIEMGVPQDKILIENKSTNTGQNILFTQQLLKEHNLYPQSFIVIQKPYMERRSYATFKKHWPDKKVLVSSPRIPFKDYPTKDIPFELVVGVCVGDLQRIKVYPEKGFQIYQEIPPNVWAAFERLVALGYTEYCLR